MEEVRGNRETKKSAGRKGCQGEEGGRERGRYGRREEVRGSKEAKKGEERKGGLQGESQEGRGDR